MDYYSVLGVSKTATDDEIKKAYRSLAMKHHPDRGGDEKKFKEVSAAYEVLSNPEKRKMVDQGFDPANPNQGGPGNFHFHSGNFDDFFNNFGFGFRPRQRQNASISITVTISLNEVLTGKQLDAEIGMPSGKKLINILIPAGVENGQQIRYPQMGDQSMEGLPSGDLIVNIRIAGHPEFVRDHTNLICEKRISVWDALLGTKITVKTLDNKQLDINIPPGTQPDTVMSCTGEGLPHMRTKKKGNLLIRIKVDIPRNLSQEQRNRIENLKNAL